MDAQKLTFSPSVAVKLLTNDLLPAHQNQLNLPGVAAEGFERGGYYGCRAVIPAHGIQGDRKALRHRW